MQVYVISLETAVARREHIEKEFAQQCIKFNFFDALTPELAKPLAEKMNLSVHSDFLTYGELACFMSHVSIWQKMVNEQIPYVAVFEDDVYLGESSSELLNNTDWIKSEAFSEKVFLGTKVELVGDGLRKIVQLKGMNLGTAGYILSLKGAQAYLNYIQHIQLIPLDQVMFDEYVFSKDLMVYQMNPALCIQEMMLYPAKKTTLSSDLLAERKERMKKQKKKGWVKVQLEIMRILLQIKQMLFATRSSFK
jgi:glycosyl transferase family 25